MMMLFPEGKDKGVARFALFVSEILKFAPELFRNDQNTPPSAVAVVDAGSVMFENAEFERL